MSSEESPPLYFLEEFVYIWHYFLPQQEIILSKVLKLKNPDIGSNLNEMTFHQKPWTIPKNAGRKQLKIQNSILRENILQEWNEIKDILRWSKIISVCCQHSSSKRNVKEVSRLKLVKKKNCIRGKWNFRNDGGVIKMGTIFYSKINGKQINKNGNYLGE